MNYEPTIGLEIHVELKTKSKMFCGCVNAFGLEKEPNVNICPVCTGQPGVLPVINEEAVKMVLKTGLALNAKIPEFSKFDRKNYFYPDLPKGYQISQYDKPLCEGGYLNILDFNESNEAIKSQIPNPKSQTNPNFQNSPASPSEAGRAKFKKIRIRRVHLEEDTGKLVHPKGVDYSLVDFNRAGVPLMELVTEPDIKSGAPARKFCQELQLILRYLRVSDADMEKGQMRCEVNISLRKTAERRGISSAQILSKQNLGGQARNNAESKLGTKVEIKNLNSFRAVEKSIDYEIKRQAAELEAGKKIVQETRGWDDVTGITVAQRTKEEAHDYRYFPEPDLPSLTQLPAIGRQLSAEIPELPQPKRTRFAQEYGLSANDIEVLVSDQNLAKYFEKAASELKNWNQTAEPKIEIKKATKLAANYLITEIPRIATMLHVTSSALYDKITPENFAEFIKLTAQGVVSSSGAQAVLKEMFASGADPSHIISEKDLGQVSDEEELIKAVDEVLSQNPGPAADYKKGKQNALMFLVGKVMAATRGKANPEIVIEMLKKRLAK